MKKNKKVTYGLLIVVVALWVLVIVRLYQSFFGEEKIIKLNQEISLGKIKNERGEKFILKANYKDPFFGKYSASGLFASVETNHTPVVKKKIEKQPEVVVDWSFLSYLGLIKNQKNQKKVALVSIHGKEQMVTEGEIIEDVTFLKYHRDSIQVKYQTKTTYLLKK